MIQSNKNTNKTYEIDKNVMEVELPTLRGSQRIYLFFKRMLDIVGSFCALLVLLPFFLIVAIAIKLDSPGSVFFKHERVGKRGQPFNMFKFRSMVDNAFLKEKDFHHLNDSTGPFFKIKDDPRITKLGRFLRKHSIDELPQFLNVFLGHMSLVGPRPLVYREIKELPGHVKNLIVKPGLTCYWQLSGRSDSSAELRIALDEKYIETFSLPVDLILLLRTPMAMLKGEGAY
ncbi:MAG: sugar transferase [Defluviitaleaceae bacterium]|nr:sugar transferase [Defluviitaleaceae bacterium]